MKLLTLVSMLMLTGGCLVETELDGLSESDSESIDDTTREVVNGSTQTNAQHPWVVRVGANCHGVLIHPRWVLTAAHCVDGSFGITFKAPANESSGFQQRRNDVHSPIYIHPDYEAGQFGLLRHDIALVKLDTPFQINRDVQTVGLPSRRLPVGRVGRVASSIDHGGGGVPNGSLSVYQAPVVTCPEASHVVCAQDRDMSLCSGDSGSGFVALDATPEGNERATVFGVTSFSVAPCTEPGKRVAFMDVYYYRNWILDTMDMTADEVRGSVRNAWSGRGTSGALELGCYDWNQRWVTAEAPTNVRGVEIGLDCFNTNFEASCDVRGGSSFVEIRDFTQRTSFRPLQQIAHDGRYAPYWEYVPGVILPRNFLCRLQMQSVVGGVGGIKMSF